MLSLPLTEESNSSTCSGEDTHGSLVMAVMERYKKSVKGPYPSGLSLCAFVLHTADSSPIPHTSTTVIEKKHSLLQSILHRTDQQPYTGRRHSDLGANSNRRMRSKDCLLIR
jgi:hypothetical protein